MNLILCKHELFMLIQFSVRMTEAMQPPTYVVFLPVTACIVFINRARSVHNSTILLWLVQSTPVIVQRGMYTICQLYTYPGSEGRLVLPLSVAEFDGLCTQFEGKQLHALW